MEDREQPTNLTRRQLRALREAAEAPEPSQDGGGSAAGGHGPVRPYVQGDADDRRGAGGPDATADASWDAAGDPDVVEDTVELPRRLPPEPDVDDVRWDAPLPGVGLRVPYAEREGALPRQRDGGTAAGAEARGAEDVHGGVADAGHTGEGHASGGAVDGGHSGEGHASGGAFTAGSADVGHSPAGDAGSERTDAADDAGDAGDAWDLVGAGGAADAPGAADAIAAEDDRLAGPGVDGAADDPPAERWADAWAGDAWTDGTDGPDTAPGGRTGPWVWGATGAGAAGGDVAATTGGLADTHAAPGDETQDADHATTDDTRDADPATADDAGDARSTSGAGRPPVRTPAMPAWQPVSASPARQHGWPGGDPVTSSDDGRTDDGRADEPRTARAGSAFAGPTGDPLLAEDPTSAADPVLGRRPRPGGTGDAVGPVRGAPVPGGSVPGGPVPDVPETLPTLDDLLAQRPEPRTGPAELGWRGAVRRISGGLISPSPGALERERRRAVAEVQRSLDGPRTIVVINPKGGAHKTTATMLIAATFGTHRGGYTLAWDNNETRGTLGWRSEQARHHNTAVNLLQDLERFEDASAARVGDLDNYVRPQRAARFDVLASDEDAASAASIDAFAFRALHRTLSRFYRVMVVDTGNNMRASNWQAAVESADQVVIVSTVREDTAQSAAWAVDALRATGHEDVVRKAVTVLSSPAPRRDEELSARLHEHFGRLTRAVLDVPYDPALVAGTPIDYGELAGATKEAWLRVTAAIAAGL